MYIKEKHLQNQPAPALHSRREDRTWSAVVREIP